MYSYENIKGASDLTLHIIAVSVQMDADLNTPLVFNRCCNSQYSKISTEEYGFDRIDGADYQWVVFHDIPINE